MLVTGRTATMAAAVIGLFSNLLLTFLKILIGILFNSQALVADGIHNAADVVASATSLGAMKVSHIPADDEHPYGHGKAEVIASGIVGILLGISAIFMSYRSVESLLRPTSEVHFVSLAVALLSLVWKRLLYVYTIGVGRKFRSKGLIATAYDHLSDVYASLAASVGIGLALIGQHFHISGSGYADPITGIVVSLLILKIAFMMGKEATDILMERNIPGDKLDAYRESVLSVPNVMRVDRIRARELGHYILVDVRASVPAEFTVQEGHDISRTIKEVILDSDKNVQEVLIHLNPWYDK